ncbi:hypothetical protein D1007_40816 [Hordeum vulgare]|nr:hypothetical protein D1007_40816 [Hordeum vulgare]
MEDPMLSPVTVEVTYTPSPRADLIVGHVAPAAVAQAHAAPSCKRQGNVVAQDGNPAAPVVTARAPGANAAMRSRPATEKVGKATGVKRRKFPATRKPPSSTSHSTPPPRKEVLRRCRSTMPLPPRARYVGHEEGGQLTEQVRRRPYSVILFDKVEKAHVVVFNTLLQVLDDGRLTDGQGRTVDLRNIVIIMTSNLGAEHLLAGMVGKNSMKVARDLVMQEVRRHFRPELLNRLDEIVVFNPLSHEQLRKVARLQMKVVAVRLAERGVALAVTDAALDVILSLAYDPVYGARPIRRWIEKRVVTQLSKMLIQEEIDENCMVYIDAANKDELAYRVDRTGGLVNAETGQSMAGLGIHQPSAT